MENEQEKKNINEHSNDVQNTKPKEVENIAELRAKYVETKAYLKQHIKDDIIRSRTEQLLADDSPIVEFKKAEGRNDVLCTLENGVSHVVPVDQTLQLFFDKMEMNPDVVVDFGKDMKDRVEILPYQNKISYIDGKTGKEIRSMPIDSNLLYIKTDSRTGNYVPFDSRLNPAILSILSENLAAQNDYINATGNINIIYNFEEKSDKMTENFSNKNLSKLMNKYYKSEKEYAEELKLERALSQKVGYAGIMDKIQSSLKKENDVQALPSGEELSPFEQAKKEFRSSIKYATDSIPYTKQSAKEETTKINKKPEIIR